MTWDVKPSTFTIVVEDDIESHRNKIVLNIHRDLVFGSAVDTGRYQNNHIINVGAPASRPRNTIGESKQPAIARGFAELVGAKGRPYAAVWISNNLPYARKLEFEHKEFSGNYARAYNNAVIKFAT